VKKTLKGVNDSFGGNVKKGKTKGPLKLQLPVKAISEVGSPDFNDVIKYFSILNEYDEPVYQMLDMFPIPIEVFAPDGTTVFFNRALMELNNVKDRNLGIGKYNLLKDPVCMEQMGPHVREEIERAFRGEIVIGKGFPIPIQDLVERGLIKEKPFEAATTDVYFYPVWKKDVLILIVCVFVVRNLYFGRPDVVKAKEYMDAHWQGEYLPEKVAKSVNMSVTQLYRVFKEHTGVTPGDYHKKIKVERIKEKLIDKNLTVKEAFAACGEDSRGWLSKVFKEITGLSPKQFREKLP